MPDALTNINTLNLIVKSNNGSISELVVTDVRVGVLGVTDHNLVMTG